MIPKRINSIKFVFPDAFCAKPSDTEMIKFVKFLEMEETEIEALYSVQNERAIFIKFNTEAQMNLRKEMWCGKEFQFEYENGLTKTLKCEEATKEQKYVRIFNLIPEIEDADIKIVLSKYGKVVKVTREKYPSKLGFSVYNGVRGAYIELSSEIPQSIFVKGYGARVYYDGIREQCFKCGGTDHKKSECQKTVQSRLNTIPTYSDVLTNTQTVINLTSEGEMQSVDKPSETEIIKKNTVSEKYEPMQVDEEVEIINKSDARECEITVRSKNGEVLKYKMENQQIFEASEIGTKIKMNIEKINRIKRLAESKKNNNKPNNGNK